MRIAVVYNIARQLTIGVPEDLQSDGEMQVIPRLVREALAPRGHDISLVEADGTLLETVKMSKPEMVLNLAEGFGGTNAHEHLVPSLLDFAGIPYTGADATNMLLVRDKVLTKQVMTVHGIRTPRYHVCHHEEDCNEHGLRFPLIVKPVREEASIGIRLSSVVRNDKALKERARALLSQYKQAVLVEEFIVGRELSVGVWGNHAARALPPCEFTFDTVDPLERFRSFEYKWLGSQERIGRAGKMLRGILDEASRVACLAHTILGCRDYSRADFRLSESNQLYFLEHNFNPGIGPNTHGLSNTFTRMAELAGVPYPEMLERILKFAVDRHARSPQ